MDFWLKVSDRLYRFVETRSGLLDIDSVEDGRDIPEKLALRVEDFDFDEIGMRAKLALSQLDNSCAMRSLHYRFLVKCAKVLSYFQVGAVYKVGVWINFDFVSDSSYLSLLRNILGEGGCKEIFFEYSLGTFEDVDLSKLNTTYLAGGLPRDLDEAAYEWYRGASEFRTRVIGFGYRKDRFVELADCGVKSERLRIKPGDRVSVIREHENSHDANAVAFLWKNGEKLGYLRRDIARFVAPLMDRGRLYFGEIVAVLDRYRNDDDRLHVKLVSQAKEGE